MSLGLRGSKYSQLNLINVTESTYYGQDKALSRVFREHKDEKTSSKP